MKYGIILVGLLCLVGSAHSQENSQKPVGEIIEIKGRAYLKGEGQKSTVLTSRDKHIPLFAGQEIGCEVKCTVRFSIGRTEKTLLIGHYVIPNLIKPRTHLANSVRAGATRGEEDILISPLERNIGLARPDSFKFRWKMLKINGKPIDVSPLTISLNGCSTDEHLWNKTNIDYKQGLYISDEIRRLLKGRQQQNLIVSVEVVVESGSFEKKQRYCSDIISISEERLLENELARWDDYADLIRHTERAYDFYQHKLYDEAADEFDMAVQLSQDTDYLLADAIICHFQLGDEDGVKSLLNRLEKLSPQSKLYNEMLTLTGQKKKM